MKKYVVELTKEQLKQLGIEVEPEFTYPLFKRWRHTGEIVRFTSITEGTRVWTGNECNKIGYTSTSFTEHTNNLWEDVVYDEERRLWDKQPCECWDDEDIHNRLIGFYDAKNECIYHYKGYRGGLAFDNYKPIPSDRYDEWILNAYETLEK